MDQETQDKLQGAGSPVGVLQNYLLRLHGIADPDCYEEVRNVIADTIDLAVQEARRERLEDERVEALEEHVETLERRVKMLNAQLGTTVDATLRAGM